MDYNDSIFVESNEGLGLLYNRYRNIPKKINEFLNNVEKAINSANRKEIPGDDKFNLNQNLEQFKQSVHVDMQSPEHIDPSKIKNLRGMISSTKKETEGVLNRLGKLRSKTTFGKNWISGILIKPKVYLKDDVDPQFHANVNKLLREINRSLDWAEKTILDLLNLSDQDLNLLSVVQKVYFRKFLEEVDIMDMDIEDAEPQFESYFAVGGEDDDTEEEDNTHSFIDDKIEEEYFPIYSIITSYDIQRLEDEISQPGSNVPENVKKLVMRGKGIRNVTLGDNYSHTLVSLDTSFRHLYHFVGTGFERDDIMTNKAFELTKSIYVNVTFLTKSELTAVKKQLDNFKVNKDQTAYDLIQFVTQAIGKKQHKNNRLMCSTFLGYLLQTANPKNTHRDFSMIRPEDITILPRAFYVIDFKDKDDFIKRHDDFEKRIKKIYDDNIDEIREYNNELPKVLLKSQMKEKGALDKFMDWMVKKLS